MKLYVNGDSHTAAAEAVNPHAFAEDDSRYGYLRRLPHPDNLAVSWGRRLSEVIKATFICGAESASSNARIMRTTREWIAQHPGDLDDVLMIIQWSTWERHEWLIDGVYYQVTASGTDDVPESDAMRYKEFVTNLDWQKATEQAHDEIWAFHEELSQQGIRHVFFNGNNHFGKIPESQRRDWGTAYIGPYDPKLTWHSYLIGRGCDTVSPLSWHFGKEAHSIWSRFMLQYIVSNNMVK